MEPLLFIIFIYLFGLLAFARIGVRWWRNYRRERWLWKWSSKAIGRPIDEATAVLGPACEVYRGTGRTLYEWKFPPSDALPSGSGLLILYVVADADGRITNASWQTRGSSV